MTQQEELKEVPVESQELTQDEREERTKRWIALIIASVALFGALLAYLKTDASAHADTAKREAKRLAIEASGFKVSSQAEIGYELAAARLWLQLGQLAETSRRNGEILQPDVGESEQGKPILSPVLPAEWYDAARKKVAEVSPMLRDPYNADYRKYYAETALAPATLITERSTEASRQDEQWGSKAGGYVLELAVLAVAVALLGLATTMRGQQRRVCLSVGGGIVLVTMGSALFTMSSIVNTLPDEAMQAYSRAVGEAYQGRSLDATLAQKANARAVASFDEALRIAPNYASAHFEKANALYVTKDYAGATASYEAAIAAGRSDTGALWNLGWNYYLLGRFEDAVRTDRKALDANADLVAVRLNLGLALLAQGKVDDAQGEYEKGINKAAERVKQARSNGPDLPYSFWVQLDRSARDLDALLDTLDKQPRAWEEAPPISTLADPGRIAPAAMQMSARLKSVSVSLEYGLPLEQPRTGVNVGAFQFSAPGGRGPDSGPASTPFESGALPDAQTQSLFIGDSSEDDTIEAVVEPSFVTDTLPYSPQTGLVLNVVITYFDYANIKPGSTILWKVYMDGQEDHSLRHKEAWKLEPSGKALKPIHFVFQGRGEYRVELYVDGQFAQTGTFTVGR